MKEALSKILLIASFILLIGILISGDFRLSLGLLVNSVLHPLLYLKFYQTIFILSIVTGVFSNLVQKFVVDYKKLKHLQEKITSYHKEYLDALKKNNKAKIEKLEKMKPEIKKMQAELMNEQMKPMGFTLVFSLPIFTWLWECAYISYEKAFGGIDHSTFPESFVLAIKPELFFVNVPFSGLIHIIDAFIFPWWLWWYIICSIASGQVLKRLLKVGT
ncbi:MAG: EMC3/TMCO1 family protein [Archaeoglobaceae archaeon]|nr:EMC3/TMCO1 family protein [Archaeoglobaceae archaeon]MCX8151441.1 EMC3/TMCO1 family protein [Archaeoglobaceae archaeon]MDW8014203.1 EMC3/TMCO1 family protein [Archaeoglobaceae archaeon]